MKNKKVEVIQELSDPITVQVLATSVREIATSMRQIESAGLNRRALLLLLAGATHIPMKEIDYVLNALGQLEDIYCVKKKTK